MPAATQPTALPSEVLMIAETQWLFTEAELLQTPSIVDGLLPEKERENRSKGVNFILQVGIMLKLPQITLATAAVFLHRFYMRYPMRWESNPQGFHFYEIAASSLFLATKVEENCRKMKELVIACVRVAQKDPHKVVDEQDKEYWRWRDVILVDEDVMLEAMCFDLSLEPPYKTLFEHLVLFGEGDNKSLRNAAWAFVSDSSLTMLCLLFPSRTIATSALYAAANHCGVTLLDDEAGRPWWEVVGVDLGDIRRACNYMAGTYEGAPSKAGKEGGMYAQIPKIEYDGNDKTRAVRAKAEEPRSPGGGSINGSGISPVDDAASETRHSKRARADVGETEQKLAVNGDYHETNGDVFVQDEHNSPRKRQRIGSDAARSHGVVDQSEEALEVANYDDSAVTPPEQRGIATLLNSTTLHADELLDEGGLVSPKLDDDVSEEGEVEA